MVSDVVGRIDVHGSGDEYERLLDRVVGDSSTCAANRELIAEFIRDCRLGKTILGRQKTKIREKRLVKYLRWLPKISFWLGDKDFREVTQGDMEDFILRLESNRLESWKEGASAPRYKAWTQKDVKLIVRKFYKWLLGENKRFPDLVAWFDTHIEEESPESLSVDEIRRCVDRASVLRGKALVWTLFETGARAEEFLNIRVGHVEDRGSHVLVRIEYPKTYKRSVPVFEGAEYLREWLEEHPTGRDGDQVFPLTYGALRQFLGRLGGRALERRVTPQLLRDSFATWLASKKVGRYQMCKLMGWAMSSKMPDRYINRVGVAEEEAIQAIRGDELSRVERENSELKAGLARLEAQCNALQERVERGGERDRFLTTLMKDPEVVDVLAGKVRENGLGEALERLG